MTREQMSLCWRDESTFAQTFHQPHFCIKMPFFETVGAADVSVGWREKKNTSGTFERRFFFQTFSRADVLKLCLFHVCLRCLTWWFTKRRCTKTRMTRTKRVTGGTNTPTRRAIQTAAGRSAMVVRTWSPSQEATNTSVRRYTHRISAVYCCCAMKCKSITEHIFTLLHFIFTRLAPFVKEYWKVFPPNVYSKSCHPIY